MAVCALGLVRVLAGPIFQFSDAWQLVINTGTIIATFLIQNIQNRDARALHLKLDELIRSLAGPRRPTRTEARAGSTITRSCLLLTTIGRLDMLVLGT